MSMKLGTPPGYSHKLDLNMGSGIGTMVLYLSNDREAFVDERGEYLPEYRGLTMCPFASAGCSENCLTHSGQMGTPHAVAARIRKTRLLVDDPETFGRLLTADVDSHLRWAVRHEMQPSFRFNGTSDYHWESWVVPHLGTTIHRYLLDRAPDAVINEYTKRHLVMQRWLDGKYTSNLYLTFSLHERNELEARRILEMGGNVTIVFRVKRGQPLPTTWWGRPVFDGDRDDLRWLDNERAMRQGLDISRGLVVGLRYKRLSGWDKPTPFVLDPQPVPTTALPMAA